MLKKILIGLLLAATQMQAVIDINGKGVNKQALFIGACKQGNTELMKLLLDAGLHISSRFLTRCLILAIKNNKIEDVKLLISAGVNVNNTRFSYGTELIFATRCNNIEIIKLFIKAGVDINYNDRNLGTALILATLYGNIEIIKLLIDAGADVNAMHSYKHAAYDHHLQTDELIEIFSKPYQFHSFSKNELLPLIGNNQTPLMYASRIGRFEIIKLLLAAPNIDLNITNSRGETAFDIACETGNIEIIELFQNYFAAQEAKTKLSQTQQATETSVITIANDSNIQLNVLHQVEVPAHSKAVITTEISKI